MLSFNIVNAIISLGGLNAIKDFWNKEYQL